jgi:hypothetical protein
MFPKVGVSKETRIGGKKRMIVNDMKYSPSV